MCSLEMPSAGRNIHRLWGALGSVPGVFRAWMASWMIAWAIAFPTMLVMMPRVRRWLGYIIETE